MEKYINELVAAEDVLANVKDYLNMAKVTILAIILIHSICM